MRSYFKRGFTLIEILVVISIIGILSAVLYTNFSDARDSSRNRALMAEIKEVQLAIELYKAQNGQYPDVPGCGTGMVEKYANTHTSGPGSCGSADYIASLVPGFINELPQSSDSPNYDGTPSGCIIEYRTNSARTWYKLTAINCLGGVDATTGLDHDDELARCPSSCPLGSSGDRCYEPEPQFYQSPAVYSFGGECK